MSTNVELASTEVSVVTNNDITADGTIVVSPSGQEGSVEAYKKEYTIVSDNIYMTTTGDSTPPWLSTMIEDVVDNAIDSGLQDYDSLVQDVRSAIDSIDIAKNTFVSTVNFSADVDSIVGTHLETLNATLDSKFATIVNLDTVIANNEYALTQSASDLRAEFTSDINARVTEIQTAYASADEAIASDVTALTAAFESQGNDLSGVSEAVYGVQTYVGLDGAGNPNGFGLLSKIHTLEKQTDGVIDFIIDTYDVMNGVAIDDPEISDDLLLPDALPYVLWTNMSGTGAPSGTQRTYMDYSLETPAQDVVDIIEDTLYIRDDFTDVNVDKYYKFSLDSWTAITEADFELLNGSNKAAHVGDIYVMYEVDETTSAKNYIKSYKFLKTEPDLTPPYSTDTEGYTWALVTDTDAQVAYTLALEARDLADGKISQFYAYGSTTGNEPTYGVGEGKYLYWFNLTNNKLYHYVNDAWVLVPVGPNSTGDVYIDTGDICAVIDVNGDLTIYNHLGDGIWGMVGPSGIISKSKFFVDLDAAVNGPGGLVEAQANLETSIVAYTDDAKSYAESKFEFNAPVTINGQTYNAGFGLVNSATKNTGGITNNVTEGNSEFWINANDLVLKNPSYPGVSATFTVNENGLYLSVDQTEATRNEFRGPWQINTIYKKGDIVVYNGSSYSALEDFTEGTTFSVAKWALYGASGQSVDIIFKRSETVLTDAPTPSSDIPSGWEDQADDATGTGSLYASKGVKDVGESTYVWGVPYKVDGDTGSRGATTLTSSLNIAAATVDDAITNNQADIDAAWSAAGGVDLTPVNVSRDQFVVSNNNSGNEWSYILSYVSGAWAKSSIFRIAGSAIIENTLSANAIASGKLVLGGTNWDDPIPLDILNNSGTSMFKVEQDKISVGTGVVIEGTNVIPSCTAFTESARKELNPYYIGTVANGKAEVSATLADEGTLSTGVLTTIGSKVNLKVDISASSSVYGVVYSSTSYTKPKWTINIYKGSTLIKTQTITGSAINKTEEYGIISYSSYNINGTIVYTDTTADPTQEYIIEVLKDGGSADSLDVNVIAESPAFKINNLANTQTGITPAYGDKGIWTDKDTGFTIQWGKTLVPGEESVYVEYHTPMNNVFSVSVTSQESHPDAQAATVTNFSEVGITIESSNGAYGPLIWTVYGYINQS